LASSMVVRNSATRSAGSVTGWRLAGGRRAR
jgi:hypothetical protein